MTEMTWLVDLGTMEYGKAWELQKALVRRRISGEIPDALLLVEHPEVITLGVRGKRDDVFTSEVPVFRIERGGEATYHGPGQLVGYPIFSLKEWPHVMDFVRKLEEVIIRASRDLGVEAGRSAQTGVWVGRRKLASIGLAVKNGVTYHGFAVNVSTDLSRFLLLKPCGMEGSVMTSLSASVGREVGLPEFREKLLARFEELFGTALERKEASAL